MSVHRGKALVQESVRRFELLRVQNMSRSNLAADRLEAQKVGKPFHSLCMHITLSVIGAFIYLANMLLKPLAHIRAYELKGSVHAQAHAGKRSGTASLPACSAQNAESQADARHTANSRLQKKSLSSHDMGREHTLNETKRLILQKLQSNSRELYLECLHMTLCQ